MSEQAPHYQPEQQAHQAHREALPAPERPKLLTAHEQQHLHEQQAESLTEARSQAEHVHKQEESSPNPFERLKADENASAPPIHARITRDLKQLTKRQSLVRLQRQETPAERALSKAIHQPAVQALSEAASKTVSRPSGLLGGGALAFAGSTMYLFMARYYGFQYNYLVFLLLFGGGFLAGLIIEIATHSITTSRHQTL